MVSINPFIAHKGYFFVDSIERVEWIQEQDRLVVKGGLAYLLRRWSPRENIVVLGKFKRGWIEL